MLNFPNAPVDGEISTQDNGVTYQWQASKTRWITPIALNPSGGGTPARPVGAMVFGYDPNPLYPGTWTQIPEGTFIMATVGNSDPAGGSNDAAVIEHDHSINDPNHNHTVPGITANSPNGNVGPFVGNSGSATYNAATSSKATGITINSQGVAGTNLNKPLYKGVQAWERTA
jgi:hypothetical protein